TGSSGSFHVTRSIFLPLIDHLLRHPIWLYHQYELWGGESRLEPTEDDQTLGGDFQAKKEKWPIEGQRSYIQSGLYSLFISSVELLHFSRS
ncbi:hypothetical protein, partial [Kroppenstedtia eburnea]